MALKNATILTGATLAASAGSAFVFADDGVTIPNGLHLVVPATADYRVRENMTVRYRPAAVQPDQTYSKDKKSLSISFPVILASGKVVINVVRIEREVHPETAAATATNYNKLAAQCLFDTDFDGFWANGSLT